jgi:8-oxo-dGTP pyrophosphatase MutT (NUDIX family)
LSVKYKQFAALPYRIRDSDVEILLITTRKKRRWSVPKGWPIKHSTAQQTAAIEAYEEAGVRGEKAGCDLRRPNLSAAGKPATE